MRSKILSVFLATLMLLSCFSCLSIVSFAATIVDGKYDYAEDGFTKEKTYWELDSDGNLTIYDNEDTSWIKLGAAVKSITFDDSVEHGTIPGYLFYGRTDITSFTISSKHPVSIGAYAFYGCTSLVTINLPVLLDSVGDYAFADCTSLDVLSIGANLSVVGKNVFKGCTSLRYVLIQNGVKVIGYGMFENCPALLYIDLPDSVESIGAHAFEGCASVTDTVIIPDSVTEIGDYAFYNCSGIKNITVGHSVENVGIGVFGNCSSLESVTFKTATKAISKWMFLNCTSLNSVQGLAEGFETIDDYAFKNCSSLAAFDIPETVKKIGDSAFDGTGLVTIDIPSVVEEIGNGAFTNCNSLTDINVVGKNRNYRSIDGALYTADLETLICCPAGKTGDYKVYDGTKTIADDAFIGCAKLTSVEIPSTVESISNTAFKNCAAALVIKADCNSYAAEYAEKFDYNTELKHVGSKVWEVSVEPKCADDGEKKQVCDACGYVYATDTIAALGHDYDDGVITKAAKCETKGVLTYTCATCGDSYTVDIPALGHDYDNGTVTKAPTCEVAGVMTFKCQNEGCKSSYTEEIPALGHDYDGGTVTKAATCDENGVITYKCQNEGCKSTYTEQIPALSHEWDEGTVTKDASCLEDGVMTYKCTQEGCKQKYTEKIPALGHDWGKGVITKPATQNENGERVYTCAHCNETKTETLVFHAPYIGRYDCSEDGSKITKIYWQIISDTLYVYENIDTPEWSAYKDDIATAVFTKNATVIPVRACYKYPNLTTVNAIAAETVGAYAFDECQSLTSLKIDAAKLEDYAFYGCTALESFDLGKQLTEVGRNVFKNCTALQSVTVQNGVEKIGYGMFEGCSALEDIDLPDSVDEIGAHAFENCSALKDIVIPDSVVTVGDYAFYNCTSAKTAYLGHNLKNVGAYIFDNCTSLEKATFKTSISEISDGMFYNCSSLTDIEGLSEGVISIGDSAFEKCSSLAEFTIPSTVETIGESAFDATALVTIDIPASVKSIGDGAFTNCTSLTDINVDGKNRNYRSVDGALYTADLETLICCPAGKTGEYTVYDGTKTIVDDAFIGCAGLTAVIIPDSVENISNTAFENCSDDLVLKGSCASAAAAYADKFNMNYEVTEHTGSKVWVTAKEASCLEDGSREQQCSECGFVYDTEIIEALGHNYDDGVVTTSPSCTEKGVKTFTCTRCSDSYTKEIPANGHQYDDGKITTKPTCEEDGVKTFTCLVCTDYYTIPVSKLGHDYDSGKVTKKATCEEKGVMTYTCANCGNFYNEDIDALGHDYIEEITKQPSCTEKGEKTFTCSICKDSYTEEIEALGHSFNEGVLTKQGDCQKGIQAEITYTCTTCTETKVEKLPLQHYWHTDYSIDYDATTTEPGQKSIHCALCGAIKEGSQVVIPAKGKKLATPVLTELKNTFRGTSLKWNKVSGADGYYIYRKSTNSAEWERYDRLNNAAATNYIDANVTSGKVYFYTVAAYKDNIIGTRNSKGLSITFLSTPELVSANAASKGIKVTWKAVNGAEKYRVYKRTGASSWNLIATVDATSYVDTSAKSGVQEIYTVRAVSGKFKSSYNGTGIAGMIIGTPKLASVSNTVGGPLVKWKAVTNAKSYVVYRKLGTGKWQALATVKGTSYKDTSAKNGKKYTYTVRAVSGDFKSAYESGISVTFVSAPKLIKAAKQSNGIKVSFSAVTGAKSYVIYRKTASGNWAKIGSVGSSATSYVDKTAKSGVRYTYTVRAVNGSYSSFHAGVSCTK